METYTAHVRCANCGFTGEATIPKETLVRLWPCPNCGCMKLNQPMVTELTTE